MKKKNKEQSRIPSCRPLSYSNFKLIVLVHIKNVYYIYYYSPIPQFTTSPWARFTLGVPTGHWAVLARSAWIPTVPAFENSILEFPHSVVITNYEV